MALINPYDTTVTEGANTGFEGNVALGVAKGLFIVNASDTWTDSDMSDVSTFVKNRIHAAGSTRWYPILQGIFDFAVAKESDVSEANPISGTSTRIRPGGFTITYTFNDGGLTLAKALRNFKGGYRIVCLDQIRQFMQRKNASGVKSGLKCTDISSDILPATGSTTFKNTLVLSVSQEEYINYSEIKKVSEDDDISDFSGLVDTDIIKAAAASTTKLKISVRTRDGKTDLIAKYGSALADLDLFIVTDKASGVVVTPTAIAVAGGFLELTGTYTTAHTYLVNGSAPSVWLTNLVEGYDASDNLGGVDSTNTTKEYLIP
jgi:hypothetical protein